MGLSRKKQAPVSSRTLLLVDYHATGSDGLFQAMLPGFNLSRCAWLPHFQADALTRAVAAAHDVVPRQRNAFAAFRNATRTVLTRPFTKQAVFQDAENERSARVWQSAFPNPLSELENRVLWLKMADETPLYALMSDRIVAALPGGGPQALPFYTYAPDGSQRQENITDAALTRFQRYYKDDYIGKWDIFYYLYALLHHPAYREVYMRTYDAFPLIPLLSEFWVFAEAGLNLAEQHLYYDAGHVVEPYPLESVWTPGKRPDWRVEKMRLDRDKAALLMNDTLTLAGIPPEVYDYRLGNRSALEWVIDQYRVRVDRRTGIVSDPNRSDDTQAIVKLVRQVVAVSVETVRQVAGLPAFE